MGEVQAWPLDFDTNRRTRSGPGVDLQLAARQGCTMAQLALAWVLALTRIGPVPLREDLADTAAEPPNTGRA